MIQSMTGYGSKEAQAGEAGKISVEIRSSNHKFLEIVFHIPVELMYLEDRMKKAIESRVKRGRLTCIVTMTENKSSSVVIHKDLVRNYIIKIREVKKQFGISDEISINTLMHLPGVLSLGAVDRRRPANLWPKVKVVLENALDGLVRMRSAEGRSTRVYLKKRADALALGLTFIKAKFHKAIKEKSSELKSDEERATFLKNTDIGEEIDRLAFHIRNFKNKLIKNGAVGKELDFIAQEMQREANTLAAKSFLAAISARVVQMKSQIEKIREQVQNVE
jgi:uncharacterized protein (TIGR00255 family)